MLTSLKLIVSGLGPLAPSYQSRVARGE